MTNSMCIANVELKLKDFIKAGGLETPSIGSCLSAIGSSPPKLAYGDELWEK